jgi:hypothetical protein
LGPNIEYFDPSLLPGGVSPQGEERAGPWQQHMLKSNKKQNISPEKMESEAGALPRNVGIELETLWKEPV